MISEYKTAFVNAVYDTNQEEALNVVNSALDKGIIAEDIVFKIIIPTIEDMLSSYLSQEASLSQHFITAKISEEVTTMLLPKFTTKGKKKGKIVLGTSSGDFHGLGKKIVAGCLRTHLYEVIDLGINISAEKFVNEAIKHDAQVIGVSSMMVHTAIGKEGALGVREILKERNLEEKIKLVVGGAPYKFDKNMYKKAGADGWAPDGFSTVNLIDKLIN